MDEVSNVNNLNGVPNMGEGIAEQAPVEVAQEVVAETPEESAEDVVPTAEEAPVAE